MRVSLIVSALFATSLLGGVALADRPGDDGGGRTSLPRMAEMRLHEMREAREARESRSHDTTRVVREAPTRERLRERGDIVDRSGSRVSVSRTQNDTRSAPARFIKERPVNEKQQQRQNCAPTDDSCGSGARSQQKSDKEKARDKAAAEKARRDQDDVQKMREKIRAEKLKARIEKMLCEKHANVCADNL